MADPTPTPNPGADNPGPKPIDEQAITMTPKQLADRLARAKPADYDDLKSKASRLDALEQANRSEIDKAADRVTKAEAEVARVPTKVADALRTHLVALHEINTDDAELFLTANDPELLLKQVQRLVGRAAERETYGNHVPREGSNPQAKTDSMREFSHRLFDSAD